MKRPLLLLGFVALHSAHTAEPTPFAPIPFQLTPKRFTESPVRSDGIRLEFPLGPVRIDYGIPIQNQPNRNENQLWNRLLDAPGPGYPTLKTWDSAG